MAGPLPRAGADPEGCRPEDVPGSALLECLVLLSVVGLVAGPLPRAGADPCGYRPENVPGSTLLPLVSGGPSAKGWHGSLWIQARECAQ